MENEYRKLLNQVRETRKQLEKRESPDLEQPEEETSGVEENPAAETTPKEPEKKEAVTDNTKEEQKFSLRKATVSKEHLGLKKWPPDELLDTPVEEGKIESIEKVEVLVEPEEIRSLLMQGFAEGISADPNKKTTDVVILPFRPTSRSFSFTYSLESKDGKTNVTGLVRVPTGNRETFEVDIQPNGITAVEKNGLKGFLKNSVLSVGELLSSDKTELARKNAENVLEVIKRVVKEKYGNTIPMIEE